MADDDTIKKLKAEIQKLKGAMSIAQANIGVLHDAATNTVAAASTLATAAANADAQTQATNASTSLTRYAQ